MNQMNLTLLEAKTFLEGVFLTQALDICPEIGLWSQTGGGFHLQPGWGKDLVGFLPLLISTNSLIL